MRIQTIDTEDTTIAYINNTDGDTSLFIVEEDGKLIIHLPIEYTMKSNEDQVEITIWE